MPLRTSFADACRTTRIRLDISQQALADAIGVSRGYIANVESGRANPSLDQAERIAVALGLEIELATRGPSFIGERRAGDLAHARCSGYVDRRLRGLGWWTAREVAIAEGRAHGWIDLLAYDARAGTLLIIELKTRLDDLGAVERQLGWYGRLAGSAARSLGWRPRRTVSWLLGLASDEVETAIRLQRDVIDIAFPVRASTMSAVARHEAVDLRRGIALVDPSNRRADWFMRTRLDGRRSPMPYAGYADAVRRLGR
jgi:transcriptional regulator with XRE-family HTH domain